MNFTIILFIAAGIILIAAIITLSVRRPKPKRQTSPYIEALHLLLENRKEEALTQLKKTVKEDSENVMAYIKLGDLFREAGDPLRAVKIHDNLLIRNGLTDAQTADILQHLILDYRTADMPDKAIETAERLARRSKKNIEHQKLLLSLYESKGNWDKAFFHRQSINKWQKSNDQSVLALYKVEAGQGAIARGAEREGRIRFREAVKLDKLCIPAYLFWGDSYRREKRNDDAIRIWEDFTRKNPEWAHLAFDRLKETLFETGRYWEIEGIYQRVLQNAPENPTVNLELADLYRNQGQFDQAIELCQDVLDTYPEEPRAWYILTQVRQQKGDPASALEEALEGLNKQIQKKTIFICSACGYESKTPLWRCPDCRSWNTFLG